MTGVKCHTPVNESFFYETAFKYNCLTRKVQIDKVLHRVMHVDTVETSENFSYESPISIDEDGTAHIADIVGINKWACTNACRPINDDETAVIVDTSENP